MLRAQQLGRYHLLDRISFGGMAEVYRAKTFDADGIPHIVAVKRILNHLAEDDDFIHMLLDEAKIAGQLRHRNIAQVYEFARSSGEYFIAMEHVDGKDLRSILDRCRRQKSTMPPIHAAYIAAEIASGLSAAHTAKDANHAPLKIVHRDVSPSNIICAYLGDVKLCDFGIAKATSSRVHTRAGVIKGKIKYMSPEQALARKLDHRSDIFSLGSVLYEMLTGTPPFSSSNEMDLLIQVRDAAYPPLRTLAPYIPVDLQEITNKCLARSRANRFQSARDVAQALRAFVNNSASTYDRSKIGSYVRKYFAAEIEQELRTLQEYVVESNVYNDVGENLISNVLGPDAEFSRFSPYLDGTQVESSEPGNEIEKDLLTCRTTGNNKSAPPRPAVRNKLIDAESLDLFDAKTKVRGVLDLPHTPAPKPRERAQSVPDEIDEQLHSSPTLILNSHRKRL